MKRKTITFVLYLGEAFENRRFASLAENGSDTIAVSDAIASLALTGVGSSSETTGENVDEFLSLRTVVGGHLLQVE